jgi:hypothetical protein
MATKCQFLTACVCVLFEFGEKKWRFFNKTQFFYVRLAILRLWQTEKGGKVSANE